VEHGFEQADMARERQRTDEYTNDEEKEDGII